MPRTLKRTEVLQIKELLSLNTKTQEEIAAEFNVSQAQISRISTGRSWRSLNTSQPTAVTRSDNYQPAPAHQDKSILDSLLGAKTAELTAHLEDVARGGLSALTRTDELQAEEDSDLLERIALRRLEEGEEE